MAEKNTFYITTPIYYVNDKPHIGHAYTTIMADVALRFHTSINRTKSLMTGAGEIIRSKKVNNVEGLLMTGTDENSLKTIQAAEKAKKSPEEYLKEMNDIWFDTWEKLGLSIVRSNKKESFIHTTEKRHIRAVEKLYGLIKAKGDIYKGKYIGLYCVGCEAFKKESDLVDGKCPDHKEALKEIEEDNLFFKLSEYREKLLEYIKTNPDFIKPEKRKREIINYIKDEMEDISISRSGDIKWGIPVPGEKDHVFYVWFDALINYISALDFGIDNDYKMKKFWPGTHLIGKDITKFHCALWPAMLMSAGLPLPKQIYVHGFFTLNGKKISKSLGNTIDPLELSEKYGNDVLRYFMLREIPFGDDGDFSIKKLEARYKGELADGLGNLLSRTVTMIEKYTENKKVPFKTIYSKTQNKELRFNEEEVKKYYENFEFDKVIKVIWEKVDKTNKYIADTEPWTLFKKNKKEKVYEILWNIVNALVYIAYYLKHIMPETENEIFKQLGIDVKNNKLDINEIQKAEPLFPRLEDPSTGSGQDK
ncbi:MAG: methionine--tRNA ligase [bacterium]